MFDEFLEVLFWVFAICFIILILFFFLMLLIFLIKFFENKFHLFDD